MARVQISPSLPSQSSLNSHARWLALTRRSPSSHSAFLYGVKSTKIYCRPTCSARLARRTNVVFYDSSEQARHDGYRPCKRCQPDNEAFLGEGDEITTKVLALLRDGKGRTGPTAGLKALAEEVGVTPSWLCRVFKKRMGMTIGTYIKEFDKQPNEQEGEGEEKSSVDPVSAPGVIEPGMESGSSVVLSDTSDMTFTSEEDGCLVSATTLSLAPTSYEIFNDWPVELSLEGIESMLDFNFDVKDFKIVDIAVSENEVANLDFNGHELDQWLQTPANGTHFPIG